MFEKTFNNIMFRENLKTKIFDKNLKIQICMKTLNNCENFMNLNVEKTF